MHLLTQHPRLEISRAMQINGRSWNHAQQGDRESTCTVCQKHHAG